MKRKEAYQLIINGVKYYFPFNYGGWRKASEFVHSLGFNGSYSLKRVYVSEDKYLIG